MRTVVWVVMVLLAVPMIGCASGEKKSGVSTTPAPRATSTQAPSATPQPAAETSAAPKQDAQGQSPPAAPPKDEAKEARDKERKIADLLARIAVGRQRVKKANLALDQTEEDHKSTLARLEAELNLAKKRMNDFEQNTSQSRIDRATLGVQWGEDGIKEQEEELSQLEITYKADEIAKETKEIVLERARRRLERSRRDLVLQKKDLNTLKTETIPREREELKLAIENKDRELAAAQRQISMTRIDRRMELLNGKQDLLKLEQEVTDLDPDALKKVAPDDKDEPAQPAGENKAPGENKSGERK